MAICQLLAGIVLVLGLRELIPGFSFGFGEAQTTGSSFLRVFDVIFGIMLVILAAYAFLCQRALRLRKEYAPGQLYSYLFFCMIWIFAYGLVAAFLLPDVSGGLGLIDGVVPFIVVLVLCFQYYRTRSSFFCQPATDSWTDRLGAVWLVLTRTPNAPGKAIDQRTLKAIMAGGFVLFVALLLVLLLSQLSF